MLILFPVANTLKWNWKKNWLWPPEVVSIDFARSGGNFLDWSSKINYIWRSACMKTKNVEINKTGVF